MSISEWLKLPLGIKGTFNDFVDTAKQNGESVDIVLRAYLAKSAYESGFRAYHCYLELKAGKTTFGLGEHSCERIGLDRKIKQASVELGALEEAVETAEDLQKRGIQTTINSKPVGEARETVTQYRKATKEARQKYEEYLLSLERLPNFVSSSKS